ncbi:hypothetical protein JW998_09305 [candidate division KSB1 bacterium]|nr:hypothetical protein [candidate division KSB1 bacterium]
MGEVKYVGPLGSPEKFSSILRRLGLDFSLHQPDLAALLSGDLKIMNAFTDRQLTYSDLQMDNAVKIFLFYRSLCMPCGEETFISELFELIKINSGWNVSLYLLFRHSDRREMDLVRNALSQCESLDCIYVVENRTPAMERYFLAGNPCIAVFSPDNVFVQARMGNKMSRLALERFLERIIQ